MSTSLPRRALEKLLTEAALPDASAPPPELGAVRRFGKYRLVRELGRGGMGVVHEAFDEDLSRRVAIKVLLAPLADTTARERFLREARAAARLDHPGIAAVHEAGEGWIAMRFVDGIPLARYPRDDPRKLAGFVRDAALAVHCAHEQGVIHRDLKPANLLVEGDRAIVTDFGLAKDASVEGDLSLSGHLLGTPAYMSPEQAQGRVREVDPRTDVWGLGATLYDLLAGRPPFAREDVPATLRAIVEDEPAPIRSLRGGIPRDLERVAMKCLAKERERRYASARELAEDLERWLAGEPVRAQMPSLGYRLAKFARRRQGILALGGASAAALCVALGFAASERAQRRASGQALGLSQQVASVIADAQMHARLGEIESSAARLSEGIAACRAFLAEHDVAQARALLGRLLSLHRRSDEARAELDRAIELDPGLVEARLERGLLAAKALAQELSRASPPASLAQTERMSAEQRENAALARADLSAAVAVPARLRALDVRFAEANLALLAGDEKRARELVEEVLRLEPLSYDALISLSQLQLVEGDTAAALRTARSAVDLHQGMGPAYLARISGSGIGSGGEGRDARGGLVPVRVEGVEGVLADLAAALSARPGDATAHANRGLVLARRAAQLARESWQDQAVEVWESAADACSTALLLDPALLEARINLAVSRAERAHLLELLGRSAEGASESTLALAELDAAIEADPRGALCWLNRGILRRRTGGLESDRDAWKQDLARALELASDERLRRIARAELGGG